MILRKIKKYRILNSVDLWTFTTKLSHLRFSSFLKGRHSKSFWFNNLANIFCFLCKISSFQVQNCNRTKGSLRVCVYVCKGVINYHLNNYHTFFAKYKRQKVDPFLKPPRRFRQNSIPRKAKERGTTPTLQASPFATPSHPPTPMGLSYRFLREWVARPPRTVVA